MAEDFQKQAGTSENGQSAAAAVHPTVAQTVDHKPAEGQEKAEEEKKDSDATKAVNFQQEAHKSSKQSQGEDFRRNAGVSD